MQCPDCKEEMDYDDQDHAFWKCLKCKKFFDVDDSERINED